MLKFKIRPYKMFSKSAKLLAEELGCLRVRDKYVPKRNEIIINWGSSQILDYSDINPAFAVRNAVNKLITYDVLSEASVKCPEWTDKKDIADSWLDENFDVVIRKKLNGTKGEGIILFTPEESLSFVLPDAPLYTKYFKKKYEYRVHVFQDKVIDFSLKKKRVGAENIDYKVRNHANGWVFCRDEVDLPDCVAEEAIKAVRALGLDFGAVDVGYNQKKNEPCVFEVNTAPGLEGTTVKKYAEAFKEYLNGLQ